MKLPEINLKERLEFQDWYVNPPADMFHLILKGI
jgi:hypothetical protein